MHGVVKRRVLTANGVCLQLDGKVEFDSGKDPQSDLGWTHDAETGDARQQRRRVDTVPYYADVAGEHETDGRRNLTI